MRSPAAAQRTADPAQHSRPSDLTVLDLLDLQLLEAAGHKGRKDAAGVAGLMGGQLEVAASRCTGYGRVHRSQREAGEQHGRAAASQAHRARSRQAAAGTQPPTAGLPSPISEDDGNAHLQLGPWPMLPDNLPPFTAGLTTQLSTSTPQLAHLKMGSWSMLPGFLMS